MSVTGTSSAGARLPYERAHLTELRLIQEALEYEKKRNTTLSQQLEQTLQEHRETKTRLIYLEERATVDDAKIRVLSEENKALSHELQETKTRMRKSGVTDISYGRGPPSGESRNAAHRRLPHEAVRSNIDKTSPGTSPNTRPGQAERPAPRMYPEHPIEISSLARVSPNRTESSRMMDSNDYRGHRSGPGSGPGHSLSVADYSLFASRFDDGACIHTPYRSTADDSLLYLASLSPKQRLPKTSMIQTNPVARSILGETPNKRLALGACTNSAALIRPDIKSSSSGHVPVKFLAERPSRASPDHPRLSLPPFSEPGQTREASIRPPDAVTIDHEAKVITLTYKDNDQDTHLGEESTQTAPAQDYLGGSWDSSQDMQRSTLPENRSLVSPMLACRIPDPTPGPIALTLGHPVPRSDSGNTENVSPRATDVRTQSQHVSSDSEDSKRNIASPMRIDTRSPMLTSPFLFSSRGLQPGADRGTAIPTGDSSLELAQLPEPSLVGPVRPDTPMSFRLSDEEQDDCVREQDYGPISTPYTPRVTPLITAAVPVSAPSTTAAVPVSAPSTTAAVPVSAPSTTAAMPVSAPSTTAAVPVSAPITTAAVPVSAPSSAAVPVSAPITTAAMPVSTPITTAAVPVSAPITTAAVPVSAPSTTAAVPVSAPSTTAAVPVSAPIITAAVPVSAPITTAAVPVSAPITTAAVPVSTPSSAAVPVSAPSTTAAVPVSAPSTTAAVPVSAPSTTAAVPVSAPSTTAAVPVSAPSTTAVPVSAPSTTAVPVSAPSTTAAVPVSASITTAAVPVSAPITAAMPVSPQTSDERLSDDDGPICSSITRNQHLALPRLNDLRTNTSRPLQAQLGRTRAIISPGMEVDDVGLSNGTRAVSLDSSNSGPLVTAPLIPDEFHAELERGPPFTGSDTVSWEGKQQPIYMSTLLDSLPVPHLDPAPERMVMLDSSLPDQDPVDMYLSGESDHTRGDDLDYRNVPPVVQDGPRQAEPRRLLQRGSFRSASDLCRRSSLGGVSDTDSVGSGKAQPKFRAPQQDTPPHSPRRSDPGRLLRRGSFHSTGDLMASRVTRPGTRDSHSDSGSCRGGRSQPLFHAVPTGTPPPSPNSPLGPGRLLHRGSFRSSGGLSSGPVRRGSLGQLSDTGSDCSRKSQPVYTPDVPSRVSDLRGSGRLRKTLSSPSPSIQSIAGGQ